MTESSAEIQRTISDIFDLRVRHWQAQGCSEATARKNAAIELSGIVARAWAWITLSEWICKCPSN